jgi:predicted oxidoreductase
MNSIPIRVISERAEVVPQQWTSGYLNFHCGDRRGWSRPGSSTYYPVVTGRAYESTYCVKARGACKLLLATANPRFPTGKLGVGL